MLLTINAPHIERHLQRAAEQQNTTPAELAQRLLEASLAIPANEIEADHAAKASTSAVTTPTARTSTERKEQFHRMLEANRSLNAAPLAPEAFSRDSFYEDERHLGGNTAIDGGLTSR